MTRDDVSPDVLSPADGLAERLAGLSFRLQQLERQIPQDGQVREASSCAREARRIQRDLERMLTALEETTARHRHAAEQADAARERLDIIFELLPVATLTLDWNGTILEANGAAVQLLNLSERHARGREFARFLLADREQFTMRLRELQLGAAPWRGRLRLRPRERRSVALDVTAAADHDRILLFATAVPDATTADR